VLSDLRRREIMNWIMQSIRAVSVLHHKLGLVHRDLKRANIIVNWDGKLVVSDFGRLGNLEFIYLHPPTACSSYSRGSPNSRERVATRAPDPTWRRRC
jgi:serine/threonine protein kinase